MRRIRRLMATAVTTAVVAAGLAGGAPAGAGAAATCTSIEGPLGQMWQIDTPPGTVSLSSNGTDLLLNGTRCGRHLPVVSVEVVGAGDLHVRIDGSRSWQAGSFNATVNVQPAGPGSSVTFKASNGRDALSLLVGTQGFATWSTTNVNTTVIDQGRFALDLDLGGGNDEFTMAGRHVASVTVNGGPGNDVIEADRGPERLFGGPGRDRIDGGASNDRIDGGPGRDRVAGGPGNDRFQMRDGATDQVDGGPGRDTCDCDRSDAETDL